MKKFDQFSDNELVTMSLEDREVFSEIIERYQNKIYRYIKRISSFSDDYVTDILQEVFIKTYINLNNFDTSLKFSSWLYRIAHNETISYVRKNKKHIESTLFPDDSIDEFAADIHIEKQHITKEHSKIVGQAIKSLSQKYQDVIMLKYFEYKSYDEISDIIQKPPGTVATWINRGKKEIQEFLKEHQYQEYE